MTASPSGRKTKRRVDVVVISDVHLGTVGCHAKALLDYLKSVQPRVLVLNGDIIDCWQFSKYYWPRAHMKVLKRLLKIVASGIPVYYVTGNHDEVLRKFAEQHLGNFHLVNKVVLELDGKRAWIFHGDVFDVVMQHARWLVKLGALGYDLLILINRAANSFSRRLGRGRISLSRRIKDGVKSAVSFVGGFEQTAASAAIEHGYDAVICGHIHKPAIKRIRTQRGAVTYLNAGDWVENLTALEYKDGAWSLFRFREGLEGRGQEPLVPPVEEAEEERDALDLPSAAALLQLVTPGGLDLSLLRSRKD